VWDVTIEWYYEVEGDLACRQCKMASLAHGYVHRRDSEESEEYFDEQQNESTGDILVGEEDTGLENTMVTDQFPVHLPANDDSAQYTRVYQKLHSPISTTGPVFRTAKPSQLSHPFRARATSLQFGKARLYHNTNNLNVFTCTCTLPQADK